MPRTLAILIALALPCSAFAQELIVERNVNLRDGPSSSHGIIRTLEPPERLVRTDTAPQGNYLEVVTEVALSLRAPPGGLRS